VRVHAFTGNHHTVYIRLKVKKIFHIIAVYIVQYNRGLGLPGRAFGIVQTPIEDTLLQNKNYSRVYSIQCKSVFFLHQE